MKTIVLKIVIAVTFCHCLSGCNKEYENNTKIAQQNIQLYIEENINKNYIKVVNYKHSPLYILIPLNEDKIPLNTQRVNSKEVGSIMKDVMDTYNGVTLTLAAAGCNSRAIDKIVENDADFHKWKTGAKEYIILSFPTFQSINGTITLEQGYCFRLSQELNIQKVYKISDEDEDYIYTRIFGQSDGRFYGAVDCEYKHLEKMYELYCKNLNMNELSIDFRYNYIKEMNELFGYERFEYMDNKEDAINNCLKKLDFIEDTKALKDKAYAKIKSF